MLTDDIMLIIPKGSKHAVSMSYIADLLHIDKRVVRQAVLRERLNGKIIASNQNGYFIPETPEELRSYYQWSRSRAMTTLKALKPVRKELTKYDRSNNADAEGSR